MRGYWRFSIPRGLNLDELAEQTGIDFLAGGDGYPFYNETGQRVKRGDGILLADFDMSAQAGRVKFIGIYRVENNTSSIQWVRREFPLFPSARGAVEWRKPVFRFAADPVKKYRLAEIFSGVFGVG
jgi:hypothetical protein